jgi:uncharacterized protein
LIFGPDFRGGLARPLYRPAIPNGLGWAIAVFLILLVINQLLQLGFGVAFSLALPATAVTAQSALRPFMIGLLPAGLVTAGVALGLAHLRGGRPRDALALRIPALGPGGWIAVVLGFLFVIYLFIALAVYSLSIDTTAKGVVEAAMAGLASDPAYAAMVGGIAIGAPLAEELTFRGQIFAALSRSRFGLSGAAVLTSLVWASIHITEPLYAIGLIFIMGLALSFLLIRFGSLWVTFACHAVWNGIYSLALLAFSQT